MMYSMEKCLGRNGTGTPEEAELFAGDEVSGRDGAPEEDAVLASAVAAVSHEIGDILKDELGAAHCADRLGAELADLGAELGLLAGLAEPGAKQDFPALLKLAMGSRECESSDSSSSWSRRAPRPARHPRRRPIAKGKEVSRRRSAAARRALCVRARRAEAGSDASDVGADSDSDDQWTELDASPTPSGSGSSSSDTSSTSNAGADLDDYRPPEIPQLRQFLLPLISNVPNSVQFRIRHDDIVQLLATEEEEPSLADLPALRELVMYDDLDELRSQSVEDLFPFEEPPVTTEEEAALLHYVCGGPRESATFQPTEDWLLGMFHSWCEVSALIYTLIGTDASAGRVLGPWAYRARAGCHCRLCVSRARAEPALAALLRTLVWALAHGGSTVPHAAHLMRALCLGADRPLAPDEWDLPRLRRIHFSDEGVAIIHNQLVRYSMQNETARQIITLICNCREYDKPLEKEFAVERLIRILECYKAASIINFQVDIVPLNDDPDTNRWINESRDKLRRYLVQYQESPTSTRIQFMAARYQPSRMSVWDGYVHSCECLTPKILCAQQRKLLLRSIYSRMSAFGLKHSASECDEDDLPVGPTPIPSQRVLYSLLKAKRPEPTSGELQQGDGTGAKPPDSESASATQRQHETTEAEPVSDGQSDANAELDDSSFLTVTDSEEHSGSASLGLSTSSLDSASELLLAAAHAVDSDGQPAPTQLCRTVRHLMRSIASIERHMDTVLKQCDEWPAGGNDVEARKQVDLGLSAVDRKLMAMYRRLPEVHRRQLQVYRKQKKLSTVCMQLVGGAAPAPPPPGSPPPAPHHLPDHTLCPEYHLQRFKEVRRKVMHMRDQQLYYHRLRMWLEDQLRQERESVPDGNVTLLGDLQRRKRRTSSPRLPRLSTATKRKLKPTTISKPHRILQLLKHKAQANDDSEASPPDAFPLERDDNSDADTVVGEKEDMNQVIATLAQIALNPDKRIQQVIAELREEYANAKPSSTDSEEEEYPESVSPPLQEMSPTTSEPMPVYTPKPTQRLINKFTDKIDFNAQIAPLNARTPVLIKEEKEPTENSEVTVYKDPNIYKYVTFGLEIKKAMEECQNIINSYNSIKTEKEKDSDTDGPLSLEQICEVMMSLDKNSAEFLTKLDTDEPIDMNTANTKLAELVENMPQILANMPEIASEFANASFELPEFASIMNSLPDVSGEAQLTPETLKQIRDLKLNKRDSVKVTKNTAKRKISRKIKSNIDTSDIIGTLTFEFDSKDIADLLKDEKELQALMKCKTQNKEEFKDLLFSISAQVVINKVFEYMKASTNPELTKCIKDEIFALPRSNINAEMYAKAATLFDNSVKDSLSMDELRATVRARFNTWKTYVTNEFKNIPITLLDTEVEGMLDKFYLYIKDLASKQGVCEREKIIEKLEDKKEQEITNDECPPPKESLKQITKILSVSVGNTFDLLLMKMSRMTGEKRAALKNMRIKYVDVLKRCAESQQLATWILSDPDLAASHIQELMGFGVTRSQEKTPDFYTMPVEKKRAYFIDRLKSINRHFMDNIPRHNVTGDEWLVMLYRLEQFENKIRDTLVKFSPVAKTPQNVSEAEILAAKGLSKIIGKANNVRVVKIPASAVTSITASAGPVSKPTSSTKATVLATKAPVPTKTTETPSVPKPITIPTSIPIPLPPSPVKKDDKPEPTSPKENTRRDVIIKCETLIAQKGNKALKDSFDAIKAYLAGEVSKPENYHDHVMAIVTNLDYSALDDEMVEVLQFGGITISPPAPTKESTVKVHNLAGHNPEELAKYSAQALRNAKQTLNAVAFKNLSRNGQSKSESDISSCDVPSSECKYTSDCMCAACKRDRSICLGDIVKISFDPSNPEKSKAMLEEKRKEKEVKVKTPAKAKPVPKQCENATHQQHVCKVGHTNNGNGSCTGDGGDQHCTCCYCTVFGHAPPLTTPVPRNFNETRERLRSILNKKKQLCKTANGEPPQDNKSPQPDKKPLPATQPVLKLAQPQPKPPALPKTLPPNLTAQAQAKRQALDSQQRMLADKMAKMVVTEKPEVKPIALQRTGPVQVNVPPSLKAEGKVNPNAMEQIRLQQLKQQQQAQFAQQLAQQKKPEPIYDLPIHNKPPQQQQQIRQELQKQQLQKQLLLQQKLKQNPVVSIAPQTPTQNPPQTTPQVQQQIQQQIQQPVQIQQKPAQPTQQIPVPVQPQIQKPTPQQVPQKPVQQVPPKPVPQVQQPVQQVQQKPIQQVQQKPLQQVQQKPVQAQQPQQIQKAPQPVNRVTPQTAQPQKPVQPQLLQKPPIQQAPRKPPPQELQQKLAQKQQQPIQKPVQPVTPQLTPQQLQQQQLQQQQLRQQQLQQQQLQQQRQSRQPNQNSVSLSSRDTSVFSTSSGCSDGSCWQGRAEDTRDLDALLQYIEGPTRHVDRGKKKAKKLRQKAKKTEERLSEECAQLKIELARVRFEAEALRVAHYSAKRRCDETRKALQVMSANNTSSKNRKKQNKLSPTQKQQVQVLAEQVGELTALMNTTAKELHTAESEVAECSQKLRRCEKEINEARYIQGKKTPIHMSPEDIKKYQNEQHEQLLEQEKMKLQQEEAQRLRTNAQWLQQQQLQQQLQQQQLQQQQLQQQQRRQQQQMQLQQRQMQMEQEIMNQIRIDEAKLLKQRQNEAIAKADRLEARGGSSSSGGSVSSTGAERGGSSPASCGSNAKHMEDDEKQQKSDVRKLTQTWEQALAHINQVAKGTKDKKKQKPAAPVKPEPKQKEKPTIEEPPPLSKKQRKKLAQQQAEEEERQQQEALQKQEARRKKKEPASPDPKAEPLTRKAEKKLEQAKRAEEAKTKKDAKRERKLEKKAEKKEEKKAKEKENNPEKNAQVPKQNKQPTPPPALTKKERKREQLLLQKQQEGKPQVVNITPHTTIEVVNKKNGSSMESDKPASCSIMEQLSSGIQVSELRLPPGITLTRVQPHEKKEPPTIKSVPLWKASQLPAAPTPVARPQPVINADPSMMMFSTAHPEPPKPIIVAEPTAPTGKSKKAKKKAKKAAAAEEPKPEGTKMVTLRNPMFHPNLPPVQVSNSPPAPSNPKKPEIRLPDPIPMPPNACQATITPTSNGMYTIRNPLMSMMHQQSMVRNPTPPFNQYKYPNPKFQNYETSPKPDDYQNRIMNLASFTQKNDEGYSLFKTPDNVHKSFLSPEYYGEEPKPVVSPNPIGTRPEVSRFEDSLFTTPVPEPIGTPLKRDDDRSEYTGLYTPFGVENPNLFRNALFNEKDEVVMNGDLPYFQRLRVGSKLNSEVTIHHVTESKFYRQEPGAPLEEAAGEASLFSRAWPEPLYAPPPPTGGAAEGAEPRYGAVGTRPQRDHESSIYLPEATGGKLSSLEACEREMESFKRFEWYFSPEPTPIQLNVNDNSINK